MVGHNNVYLALLLNVVKFNSSHLDEATIEGIVQHLCIHCTATSSVLEMESLLKVTTCPRLKLNVCIGPLSWCLPLK